MPRYISPKGFHCTSDEAKAGGQLRPGYQEVLEDGESTNFSIMALDASSRSKSSVFMVDESGSALTDRAVRDAVRAAQNGDYSASVMSVLKDNQEAAYQRSKTALNDWRDEGKAAVVESARFNQYL